MVSRWNFDKGLGEKRRAGRRLLVRRPWGSVKSRGLVTFCVALSLLLLGGCRTDSTFEFKADGSVRTEIIVEDETGSMRTLKGNCDELRTVVSATRRFLAEGKTEDVTPPNGNLTCKITSKVMPDNVKFEERNNSYTITLPASKVEKPDSNMPTAKTTIIMPGRIMKTSVGSVSGNKVIINGIDYIVDGFTITSRKDGSARPAADASTTTADSSGRRIAQGNSSLWVWIAVGCGALAALALGGIMVAQSSRTRKRRAAVQVGSVLHQSFPWERMPPEAGRPREHNDGYGRR